MGLPVELHPYIAIGTTLFVFLAIQLRHGIPTDLLFLTALMVVTVTGVISPGQALSGFANPAPLTVAALLAVAAGLRSAGVLDWVGRTLLGQIQTERRALFRLAAALISASAFMLNTAVVAMMMPVIIDWCRKHRVSPSRLLIPLSYLTILGGVCTLVGTSTTLVANGVLCDEHETRYAQLQRAIESRKLDPESLHWQTHFVDQIAPMGLFELGYVGLPCALVGGAFLVLVGPKLLPSRTDIVERVGEQPREYLVEMMVQPDCPLIGKTVEQAGLRQLPGLFLIEIDRDGDLITPVTPNDSIGVHDRLVFTGVVSTIIDLEKIPGFVPAADLSYELDPSQRAKRRLTEVVLSRTSPLIGTTVREANFRHHYNAAVVAVHRNGEHVTSKIGDIVLEPGDTLLLQTRTEFVPTYRNHRDFYLVSAVKGSQPRLHHKMKLASTLAILLVLLLCLTTWIGNTPAWTAVCGIAIAMIMILTRCVSTSEARSAIDVQMLLTIVGALGLGRALTTSGAAQAIASSLTGLFGADPMLLLLVVYIMTLVFTEAITNNAVAAMLLPVAIAVAWEGHYNPRPFIIAITLGASLSFLTPIGYQTNLMVMGPGGYRPADFLRCGIPLTLLVMLTAMLLIPAIWTF